MTLIIAGAAGAGLWPSNSLTGCKESAKLGVHGIEIDVQLSADNQVVVFHDLQITGERVKDQSGNWYTGDPLPVKSLTVKELQQFDMGELAPGHPMRNVFPDQQAVPNERIATLQQVFAELPPQLTFFLELKNNPEDPRLSSDPQLLVERVIDCARDANRLSNVHLIAFDWSLLRLAKELEPKISVGNLTASDYPDPHNWMQWHDGLDITAFDSEPDAIAHTGGDFWDAYLPDLTPEKLKRAHDLGLKVSIWGIGKHEKFLRLIDSGIDYVTTIRPDRFKEFYK